MTDRAAAGLVNISNVGEGFRDATMLTYWGSVIVEANTTGFAMEFIGDMNDSMSAAVNYQCVHAYSPGVAQSFRGLGRDCGDIQASGVNLQ
jgi:hypothetical protein